MNTDNTEEKQKPQLYKPGQSGNPEGRPKGSKNYLTLLEEALLKYEKDNGKKLFDRLIQRAFQNDTVLLSVAKKFVADKTQTEITTPDAIEIVVKHEN